MSKTSCIFVEGGHRLSGEVVVSGAKNAALPALAATLLAPGEYQLFNVPDLLDIKTMLKLLSLLGAKWHQQKGSLVINTSLAGKTVAPYEIVNLMRASVLVLGPLVARAGEARVARPGGCPIGKRPIDLHLKGLEAMGAKIKMEHGDIVAKAPRRGLSGAEITFDFPSVTATENLMMAAVLARGKTTIRNAAREPEVVFLGDMLVSMGARIKGHGTETISIEGVKELSPTKIKVIPDRIEAGTYLMAPAVTGGEVEVKNLCPEHLETVIATLKEMGLKLEVAQDSILSRPGKRLKPLKVRTAPYPGFPTDLQAQIMAVLSTVKGTSVIVENIFEDRFHHVEELKRLGADITVEGRVAVVNGVKKLQAAPVKATDLRASASLVLAGLGAEGVTQISEIHHLKRGYEDLCKKFSGIGAKIWEGPCQH
ncbi:UDP-N-acetylglucosamine 1-carboxyvinyltransferase [Thermodesulfatator autotrophicus]|uniref:UDP-N-acetylglucosamine 1-carboxyvinyltransferase n=1 Tax=Thermodesulfatator autotrophicus TaxID=1795632 RepID=A0A177E812_9BACT|nr:UDP-N-acetylglucosamine 1-carboxyvinyltransferase [Thermodesulfatator autotrophicus]OAG27159.1 UDP-N-acetylglucosamine 1-carboxyvinyltransferase [Thermodesulfatator autotrophicus]